MLTLSIAVPAFAIVLVIVVATLTILWYTLEAMHVS
jgi:hypothetical protein